MSKVAVKWEHIPVSYGMFGPRGGNYILTADWGIISYQPWEAENTGRNVFEDINVALTGDTRQDTETALHDGKTWRILWGDHRKAYEKVFPDLEACIKLYETLKPKYGSTKWSTDYD